MAPQKPRPLLPDDLNEISMRLLPVAEHFRKARILITGASGFIGGWLTESILNLDERLGLEISLVVNTRDPIDYAARLPHLSSDYRVLIWPGELGEGLPFEGLKGISHVVHAGSNVNRNMTSAEALDALQTLDQGTESLLRAGATWPLRRMLYVSSAAVYDLAPSHEVGFSDAVSAPPFLGTISAYATGKRVAELRTVLHASIGGYGAVVARLGAFLGPRLPLNSGFAAGNFIADALAGRCIKILGDGTPLRCYQYPVDMSVWLWTLLAIGQSGEAYNVGGGLPISLRELAEQINVIIGGPGIITQGTLDSSRHPDVYLPPVNKIQLEMGLSNCIKIEEAIRRTLQWYGLYSSI